MGAAKRVDSLPLSLDSGGGVAWVAVGASTGTAARVVRELRPWQNGVRLRVEDGTVRMLDSGTLTELDLATRLRAVPGIEAVRRPGARR